MEVREDVSWSSSPVSCVDSPTQESRSVGEDSRLPCCMYSQVRVWARQHTTLGAIEVDAVRDRSFAGRKGTWVCANHIERSQVGDMLSLKIHGAKAAVRFLSFVSVST